MKITIENTAEMVSLNGVMMRIWEGVTESGIRVQCLITRVAVHKDSDCSQFDRELEETEAPRSDMPRAFPLRMIL